MDVCHYNTNKNSSITEKYVRFNSFVEHRDIAVFGSACKNLSAIDLFEATQQQKPTINMKSSQYCPYISLAIMALSWGVNTQICSGDDPTNNNSCFYQLETLIFPLLSDPFNVSDNVHHRWQLEFTSYNVDARFILFNGERAFIVYQGTLYDTLNDTAYPFFAEGAFQALDLRFSPDYRWAALYNMFMEGTSEDGSLKFNVSIGYADFWNNIPANLIYDETQLRYFDNSPCSKEVISSYGGNYVQSKGFWIVFDFDDGSHLYFNTPPGPSATISSTTSLYISKDCT